MGTYLEISCCAPLAGSNVRRRNGARSNGGNRIRGSWAGTAARDARTCQRLGSQTKLGGLHNVTSRQVRAVGTGTDISFDRDHVPGVLNVVGMDTQLHRDQGLGVSQPQRDAQAASTATWGRQFCLTSKWNAAARVAIWRARAQSIGIPTSRSLNRRRRRWYRIGSRPRLTSN